MAVTFFLAFELSSDNAEKHLALYDELDRLGAQRALKSFWWVRLDDFTSTTFRTYIKQFLGEQDRLFIIKNGGWAAFRPETNPVDN